MWNTITVINALPMAFVFLMHVVKGVLQKTTQLVFLFFRACGCGETSEEEHLTTTERKREKSGGGWSIVQ